MRRVDFYRLCMLFWFTDGFPRAWFMDCMRKYNAHSRALCEIQTGRALTKFRLVSLKCEVHNEKGSMNGVTHSSQVCRYLHLPGCGKLRCPEEVIYSLDQAARVEVGKRPLECKAVMPWFETTLDLLCTYRVYFEIDCKFPALLGMPDLRDFIQDVLNTAAALLKRDPTQMPVLVRSGRVRVKGTSWFRGTHVFLLDVYMKSRDALNVFVDLVRGSLVKAGRIPEGVDLDKAQSNLRVAGQVKVEAYSGLGWMYQCRIEAPPYTDWEWRNTEPEKWPYTGIRNLTGVPLVDMVNSTKGKRPAETHNAAGMLERNEHFVAPGNDNDVDFTGVAEAVEAAFGMAKGSFGSRGIYYVSKRFRSATGVGIYVHGKGKEKKGGPCFLDSAEGVCHKSNATTFTVVKGEFDGKMRVWHRCMDPQHQGRFVERAVPTPAVDPLHWMERLQKQLDQSGGRSRQMGFPVDWATDEDSYSQSHSWLSFSH